MRSLRKRGCSVVYLHFCERSFKFTYCNSRIYLKDLKVLHSPEYNNFATVYILHFSQLTRSYPYTLKFQSHSSMDERQQVLRAVHRGDIEVLRKMKDHFGLDWSKCVYDKTGDSALHIAARAGHPLLMRFNDFLTSFPTF